MFNTTHYVFTGLCVFALIFGTDRLNAQAQDTTGTPVTGTSATDTSVIGTSYTSQDVETDPNIDNRYVFTTDRVIHARLETGVNSQLKNGVAIFGVSRDTYSYHGWGKPLIPVGSRFICTYEGPKIYGETRVSFKCNRLILAEDRRQVLIKATVSDIQGSEGLSGAVDNRNWERHEDLRAKFGEVADSVLSKMVNLKPIVTIPQGTLALIRPSENWYLPPVELSNNVRK